MAVQTSIKLSGPFESLRSGKMQFQCCQAGWIWICTAPPGTLNNLWCEMGVHVYADQKMCRAWHAHMKTKVNSSYNNYASPYTVESSLTWPHLGILRGYLQHIADIAKEKDKQSSTCMYVVCMLFVMHRHTVLSFGYHACALGLVTSVVVAS